MLETVKRSVVDIGRSLAIVAVISGILFIYAGVWPPLVVIQSGSMEPHLHKGDVVLIKSIDGAEEVDTYRADTDSRHFGLAGDVVIYDIPGDDRTVPVIHRARYWVSAGDTFNGGTVESPGFITKGDANVNYDQKNGIANAPVRPEWIKGRAVLRVPFVGYVRLLLGDLMHASPR